MSLFDSIGGAFDTLGSWGNSLSDWGKSNSGWLGPAFVLGGSIYNWNQKKNEQDAYKSWLNKQNKQSYLNNVALQNYYNQMLGEQAAGAEEAMGTIEEAMGSSDAMMQEILAMYAPYLESAKRLLPYQEAAGKSGLEGLSALYAKINTPEALASMLQQPNVNNQKVLLPSYLGR